MGRGDVSLDRFVWVRRPGPVPVLPVLSKGLESREEVSFFCSMLGRRCSDLTIVELSVRTVECLRCP